MAALRRKNCRKIEPNAKAPMKMRRRLSKKQRQHQRLIHAVSEDNKELPSDSRLNTSLSHNASEDESSASPVKKRGLICPGSNTLLEKQRCDDGFSFTDEEEEIKMETGSGREPVFDDLYSESDDDVDDDEHFSSFQTDHGVLNFGRYSWRRADGLRETYFVILVEDPREAAKCKALLAKIGCEDRFVGCSVENDLAFFAQLNEEEAAKMQGLKEIHDVDACRNLCFTVA